MWVPVVSKYCRTETWKFQRLGVGSQCVIEAFQRCKAASVNVYILFRGQSPAQAELNFLDVAKKIPRYGVDMHFARVCMFLSISLNRNI